MNPGQPHGRTAVGFRPGPSTVIPVLPAPLRPGDMADPLNIALVGGGTVGGGVAKLLLQHPDRVAARAGRPVHLKRVVVRDPNKPRPTIPKELISTDIAAVI